MLMDASRPSSISPQRRNDFGDIELKVVSTPEELHQAMAIRTLVYVGEQRCPWNEEFDGNDFTATQILGTCGGEPVATARVRWFAEFAKLERLAVRQEFRGGGFGHDLLRFLLELCAEKGFARVYLHAQRRLERFYARYGFTVLREPFAFSDHDYLEMTAEITAHATPLSLAAGPLTLNRPEGAWRLPGVLDRSAARGTARAA